ncbi:MAG: hypothetical protein A2289_05570 [Deltaproteobacteria bacterium RIFOXYA12_FULL_58_15]|nr:MAG: hypothetical protein A2289_05570 [Deltaproteobacteria bacterium RIFOXYA12_FULL_58_15]OGR14643.1 MAG: hypothetical protein A2341_22140 [Deltaproteobacteria bacterium RIFOXYB12_FULL_58_9]
MVVEERFVRSFDGTSLLVLSWGRGLPVVLCDGIGCNGFILRYLLPALQPGFQVVSWHYRGHGQSDMPADPNAVGVPELRQDLLAVLDELGIERAVLLGYSMGVQLSLDFAIHYPERVVGLVEMCGTYGHLLETFHGNRLTARLFPVLNGLVQRLPRVGQEVWRQIFASELTYQLAVRIEVQGPLVDRADFQPYFDHLVQLDVQLFFRMLDQVRKHTVEQELHFITAPTLIVAGERDNFAPVWVSKRMQKLIAGSELLIVPWGTHIAPLEMPGLVGVRVRRFLEERVLPVVGRDGEIA